MTHKKLIIVGNHEIAAMAYEYFTHDSEHDVVAFTVGADYITEPTFMGLPVVATEEAVDRFPPAEHSAFVAIGDTHLNRLRRRFFDEFKGRGYSLASYVSSHAFRWRNVDVGENCFILENNVLQPFVSVGDNVTLWSGNHIGHRTVIEDNVFIASHVVISGYCRIGRNSFMGVNASTAHQVKIAEDNFIAMGAVVTKDTEADRVYMGAPAKARDVPALRFLRIPAEYDA